MSTRKKSTKRPVLDQEKIDEIVISQSEDDTSWSQPIRVIRSKPAALSMPGELAARAAFLARLHREPILDKWVERVVRERVELEELAFKEVKKQLGS